MSGIIGAVERLLNSVPGRVLRKFLEDQAPNWAVLIAWNALFAMFPILVFAAAVIGLFLSVLGVNSGGFYTQIMQLAPDSQTQAAVEDALRHFQQQKGVLLIVGIVGLLWGGSALFGAMEQGFAVIYHTKPRDFLPQKLMAVGMVFVFIVTAVPVVASSAILPALKNFITLPDWLATGAGGFLIQFAIGVVGGFILFGAIYYVVPNRRQQLHKVLPGALLSGVLFELVTLLFPLYIALTNSVATYGKTFGLFFVLMTFFFFLGLITMVGVELNSVLYPVPIELPGKDSHAVAPPQSGPAAERFAHNQPGAEAAVETKNGQGPNGRRRIPAAAAVGMAVAASVVGVLLGRRSASSN
jgi:membrane protein